MTPLIKIRLRLYAELVWIWLRFVWTVATSLLALLVIAFAMAALIVWLIGLDSW